MASSSSSSNKNSTKNSANEKKRAFSPNTTVIRTDPSNFKSVVLKFTGFHRQKNLLTSPHRLPAAPLRPSTSGELGPRMPVFKLHERRRLLQSGRKLEDIMLNQTGILGGGDERVAVSPVSPFDLLGLGGSPRWSDSPTPRPAQLKAETEEEIDEELRGIKANGFYLHPFTLAMMAIGYKPPPLMPLLPTDDEEEEDGGSDVDNGNSTSP